MLIRVPLSWLREYVDVTVSADDLAHRLHMAGTESKGIERKAWDRIWVGRIAELAKHPGADKLQLATVEYGEGRRKTVVTGATNLKPGSIVAYGEVGAEYLDGHTGERMVMKPKDMRGIKSEGMVMSEKELGIGEDHDGILLLDPKLPVGAPLSEALGETVLLLELQPNRPDCLGILGIAREVSALLETQLREPERADLGRQAPKALDVRIEDTDACRRFAVARLDGVRIGPSPEWMQRRLVAAGMRPISNVVDITNYVMLEHGQPLHAFDHDVLVRRAGGKPPTITVRPAKAGERLKTLDGQDREARAPQLRLDLVDAGSGGRAEYDLQLAEPREERRERFGEVEEMRMVHHGVQLDRGGGIAARRKIDDALRHHRPRLARCDRQAARRAARAPRAPGAARTRRPREARR